MAETHGMARDDRPLTLQRRSWAEIQAALALGAARPLMICRACHGCTVEPGPGAPAYIVYQGGYPAAWGAIERGERPASGQLTLAAVAGQELCEPLTLLLRALAGDALASGFDEIDTLIESEAAYAPLAAAGLTVLASLAVGGSAEVRLATGSTGDERAAG